MTDTTGVTTYTYDAANRLTSVDGVTYTWDARGNLTNDGVFTYTYNAAGRMVQAQGVTSTVVYTYNAAGLRVSQSVESSQSVFSWDWASGLPEMLSESGNLYLVGHETLGQWDGSEWAYYLPDALGSVRQVTDGADAVVSAREWTPYGIEVGAAQARLGYTGEYWDADVGLEYLRARWYDGQTGRFVSKDPFPTANRWLYADANPVNRVDPSGYFSNNTIAYSLGVDSFESVIQRFRSERSASNHLGGRWGLLKLLQEAEDGDTLSWLSVAAFGAPAINHVGEFRSAGCTIMMENIPLQPWLTHFFNEEVTVIHGVQAWYLDDRGVFRDTYGGMGYGTNLPDFALVTFNAGSFVPLVGPFEINAGWAHIVDRYGNAYLTVIPFTSLSRGGGSPITFGYAEGWVNRWNGDNRIASPEELDQIIPGLGVGINVDLMFVDFGAEISLDPTWNNLWVGTMGFFLGPSVGVSGELGITMRLPREYSTNPDGWIWVEELPRYSEHDITR